MNLRTKMLLELGYDSYDSYLKSSHWRRVKANYRLRREWVCICGTTLGLQLHHKTYERIGNEHFNDLVPLCQECHTAIHQGGDLDPYSLERLNRITEYSKSRTDSIRVVDEDYAIKAKIDPLIQTRREVDEEEIKRLLALVGI